MFVITNRNIGPCRDNKQIRVPKDFGKKPNPEGPNELRVLEATKSSQGWKLKAIPDVIKVKNGEEKEIFASQYIARKLAKKIIKEKKNLLFFVHGFNNDFEALLDRAHDFSRNYNLEVVSFSWPANGGGIRGISSYKSDKSDAKLSAGALDRCFEKMHRYIDEIRGKNVKLIIEKANRLHPANSELRDEYISEYANKNCPFTINLLLHSMGNYLFKNLLQSSIYHATELLFDNVLLVAADTNNKNHADCPLLS